MYKKTVKLENGLNVPVVALGTWLIDDGKVAEAVREAVKIGYRHVDTAQAYEMSVALGKESEPAGFQEKNCLSLQKSQQNIKHTRRQKHLLRRRFQIWGLTISSKNSEPGPYENECNG